MSKNKLEAQKGDESRPIYWFHSQHWEKELKKKKRNIMCEILDIGNRKF